MSDLDRVQTLCIPLYYNCDRFVIGIGHPEYRVNPPSTDLGTTAVGLVTRNKYTS